MEAALEPVTLAAVIAVCFAAGLIGSVSGFGSGLLVTLFITPIIGAKAVIPVISVLMLINNASRVWFFRKHLRRDRVLAVAGPAIPAAALGALLYVRLEGDVVQGVLGVVLIGSVPLRRWMAGRRMAPSRAAVVGVSGTYGFLSSIIVGAGMLVIPMLMGLGLAGPALIATDAAIAVLVNFSKVVFFGRLDALTVQLFLLAAAMGLCTVPGAWAGAWLVKRTDIRLHTTLIEALVVAGGAAFLWGSVS